MIQAPALPTTSDDRSPAANLVEIERRFLLHVVPNDLDPERCDRIEQGYLAATDDGVRVRVRKKGERHYLTVKHGYGRSQTEAELEIEPPVFEALWPLTTGRRIVKQRYYVSHGDDTLEIDVFEGALEGLLKAEVEFSSEDAAEAFEPPSWFGEEVTDDERYRNHSLAMHGLPVAEVSA